MGERDLSSILFITDRRLRKAIFEDMRTQSVIACTNMEDGKSQNVGSNRAPGASPFEGENEESEKIRNGERMRAPLPLGSFVGKETMGRGSRDPLAAGVATKKLIRNVYPQLASLSGGLKR